MDFSELDYQAKVRDSLNKILTDKCSQDKLKNFDDGFKHDEVLLSLLAKNGYLGLGINEEFGGSGEDLYDLGILFERLGYYAAPLSLTGCLVDVAQTIQKFSETETHKSILKSIVKGELYTSAILEPNNQDPENPITKAKFNGDKILVNGVKYLSEIASVAKSMLVSVSSDEGVLLVLIDKDKVKLTPLASTANSPIFKVEINDVTLDQSSIIHGKVVDWMR